MTFFLICKIFHFHGFPGKPLKRISESLQYLLQKLLSCKVFSMVRMMCNIDIRKKQIVRVMGVT